MNARSLALGLGSALSTFLVAGVVTIELLGGGEAPEIGIIGVTIGFVAGLLAGGLVALYATRLSGVAERALLAYATFGVAFVGIAGMRYVNVSGEDDVFGLPVHVGGSVLLAIVAATGAGRTRRGERPTGA